MIAQIIGVDCATDPRRVGVAAAHVTDGLFRLTEAVTCSAASSPANIIANWIRRVPGVTLLTLDAPLGWPTALGANLASHTAGQPLHSSANMMFRRETDREIAKRFRKTPLDVGADRIARTAHWALNLLDTLRSELGEPIPLAWSPNTNGVTAAIEVYPAATLLAHGIPIRGYKTRTGTAERTPIFDLLHENLGLSPDASRDWTIDTLDAAVCVLAGVDFLSGKAEPPVEPSMAAREGWIWVRAISSSRNASQR